MQVDFFNHKNKGVNFFETQRSITTFCYLGPHTCNNDSPLHIIRMTIDSGITVSSSLRAFTNSSW